TKKALLFNGQGNVHSVTAENIEALVQCPEGILWKTASVAIDFGTVSIGYINDGQIYESLIERDSKENFAHEEGRKEPIHPQLMDGEYRTLRGNVSRGNQITMTIGFQYDGHIITCEPNDKLITGYIGAHYKTCDITGRITRTPSAEVALGKRDRP